MTKPSGEDEDLPSQQHAKTKYTTLPRLYIGPSPICPSASTITLNIGTRIALSPEHAHYVTKVMRIGGKQASNKNRIRIFDGAHGEWLAEVLLEETDDSRKRKRSDASVFATCLKQLRPQPTSHEDLPWLYLAPLKKVRMKMILEKCTELGVGGFTILATDRTDPLSKRDCQELDRLAIQITEASEQCERLTVPALFSLEEGSVKSLLDAHKERSGHLLVCRERTSATPVLLALSVMDEMQSGISFLVGPEGGWSSEEESYFDIVDCKSIRCVSLGPHVLRAETAAMTVVASYALFKDTFR